jgi:hypothetical protein
MLARAGPLRDGDAPGELVERSHLAPIAVVLAVLAAPAAAQQLIFADGFESGATIAWSEPRYCAEVVSHALTESIAGLQIWSVPAAHKVGSADASPTTSASGIRMVAARGEFEPAVLALRASGAAPLSLESVTVAPFADLGTGATIDVGVAGYSGSVIETLAPPSYPIALPLASAPVVLWITVRVPADASPGVHRSSITLDVAGESPIVVPLELFVFDFALPPAATFGSQFDVAFSNPADAKKQLLFDHRLTPKSPIWPSGFSWSITWDQSVHPETACTSFDDETDHESPAFAAGNLAETWLHGTGWNGVGFPDFMAFQFVDNSTPRPSTFCGISRETGSVDPPHWGSAAYNAEWSDWLADLEGYLSTHDLLDKAYVYVQNEPQSAADDDLAAHLCRLSKAAAPDLRLAISEQPKPSIAENAAGACGYDLWIASLSQYAPAYGAARQALGEEVWLYSLPTDSPPYPNPTLPERQGWEARMLPWVAASVGARGWAYYDGDSFLPGGAPSVRLELLREGFEDYEYLVLANGGVPPGPAAPGPVDGTLASAATGLANWNREPESQAVLRCELGRWIAGLRSTPPTLERESTRPRGAYYVNFQDPLGPPPAPVIVDGKTYLRVGWESDYVPGAAPYYGWIKDSAMQQLAAYYAGAGTYSVIERSYLYDDYGRQNLFEFELAPGRYLVTVGVGKPGTGSGDPHNLVVEGHALVDDEVLSDIEARSAEIQLIDGSLSFVVGGKSASTGNWSYTFVSYVQIEPID